MTAAAPALAGLRARRGWREARLYIGVGLVAGATIALQLAIMRVFAVGSWAHFGSLVVSLAMLGFGLTSVVLCVARRAIERHASRIAAAALILFAPLVTGSNLLAQQLPFNAMFMLADPSQRWRLAANFALYLLPFLAGAVFLGVVFIENGREFGRFYFADLAGAGLGGAVLFAAMYAVPPENLVLVPVALGAAGAALWLSATAGWRVQGLLGLTAVGAVALHVAAPPMLHLSALAVSDYKGVAYARKFPDSERVYRAASPFGDLQVYASSFLHFAPGLSDNAAFNLPELPKNSFLGLYIDGDGPIGVMRDLPGLDTRYFDYLPMVYPYLLAKEPKVFVVQFGGGISTRIALSRNGRSVTIAEKNPAVIRAFTGDRRLRTAVRAVLGDPRVRIVEQEGRLYLASAGERFDVIDLSLTNSFGLTSPGGFSITESVAYTEEAMQRYMRALAPGGILAVTVWNKEEPPKSVFKLYTTMTEAARAGGAGGIDRSFFAVANYLSTATVLYKNGGFTAAEIARLRDHTAAMSFDEIYVPGEPYALADAVPLLAAYREQIFGAAAGDTSISPPANSAPAEVLPATALGRLAWHHLIRGDWPEVADQYVFDTRPLTDDRPYFAAYVKLRDLPRVVDRLDVLQDEWGYLLLWATLGVAWLGAGLLVALPLAFGWRALTDGGIATFGTVVYFACLGLGYIAVEIGLMAKFALALGQPTVAAAVVIPGMLVLSGIGSLISGRCLARERRVLPPLLVGIAALLTTGAVCSDMALGWIGALPMALRVLGCLILLAPPALAMGFPMPVAMTALAQIGKDYVFVWAWGINGCFSVVGAALVPIIGTAFGLGAVLALAALAYLLAIPALPAVLRPPAAATIPAPASAGGA